MCAATWDQTKAAAMAILGNKAKIPEPRTSISKFRADMDKADKEYDAAVNVLQTKILNLQNGNSAMKNAIKQFQDQISKNNFGLNPDDDGVEDKIDKAQKILDDFLDKQMDVCDINNKNLDELDKHSMAISKYQTKTS